MGFKPTNLDEAFGNVAKGAGDAINAVSSAANEASKNVTKFAGNVADSAAEFAGNTAEKIAEGAGNAGKVITAGAGNIVENVAGAAGTVAKNTQNVAFAVSDKAGEAIKGVKANIEEAKAKSNDPNEYEQAVINYNEAYANLENEGISLYQLRLRSIDLLDMVTTLINSLTNTPKSFVEDIEEISYDKKNFKESESFAREELESAKKSAAGAGAGIVAGMAVASMAPTAAVWVATTFGTASTGTAISALSGAAATSARIAWLGGGALAAGGGGMAAGNALLAMAGPIGWGVAGATLLASIVLFVKKKHDIAEEKHKELMDVVRNTYEVKTMSAMINSRRMKTDSLRVELTETFMQDCRLYGSDFLCLSDDEKLSLGALVNNAKSLGRLLIEDINSECGE